MFPPSYGDIFIDGDSISKMSYEVQERTGICNQFDYFWPEFTPRQMFNVIGAFKGYPTEHVASELRRLMDVFQMQAYIDRSSELWGSELTTSQHLLWRHEAQAVRGAGVHEGNEHHHSGRAHQRPGL